MPELKLYTNPMSRGRIARWMLEEIGAPYESIVVDLAGTRTPELHALNPMGKVPTLVHGETVVTETAAICAYLADAFPQAGLAPAAAERGGYYRWLFFAAGPVEQAVTAKMFGLEAPEERAGTVGYGSFARTIDALETAVTGRDYVAGLGFTAADVYLGSQIGWGMQFGTIEKRPAFQAYWKRLSERPAYRRASELDDAAMPRDG